jgi:xylose isomerase
MIGLDYIYDTVEEIDNNAWEACAQAAQELDKEQLMKYLATRETAKAEDIMREALVNAQIYFNKMYKR